MRLKNRSLILCIAFSSLALYAAAPAVSNRAPGPNDIGYLPAESSRTICARWQRAASRSSPLIRAEAARQLQLPIPKAAIAVSLAITSRSSCTIL